MNLLGHITLNLSSFIYLFWLLPQVWYNFKRQNMEGLSLWMHELLCLGYLADLLYGLGLHMPWQYRMVTLVGLLSLSIQHWQFWRYGFQNPQEKYLYGVFTGINLLALLYALLSLNFFILTRTHIDWIGMVSNACWLIYLLPQLLKNYVNRSTAGLSYFFVGISLFLNIADLISALTLGWDYPSKVGTILGLTEKIALILQVVLYAKASMPAKMLGSFELMEKNDDKTSL